MTRLKKYWMSVLAGTLILSFYPLYMGFRVIYDMVTRGTVLQEDYPKYIIPYTPISLAVIAAVILMTVFLRYAKRAALLTASTVSLGIFFLSELLLESKVIVTSEVNTTLESWQMYMCIAYLPPEGYGEKIQRAVDVLIGDYSPAFKLHFYLISVILIISALNCLYGFAQIICGEKRSRMNALIVQSVCSFLFLCLCILACFTAFFRNGEITVPAVSAILMSLFFVVFGVTAGVYAGSFLLGKKMRFSIMLPAVIASLVTLLMYIGEMCLLGGHLYRFGFGFLFDGIPGIILSLVDVFIIVLSGCITAVLENVLNKGCINKGSHYECE